MPYGKGYKERSKAPKTKNKNSQAMQQQNGGKKARAPKKMGGSGR